MANNDRVYLAYSGQLGEEFQIITKRRIDWILEQARFSKHVLDIGCSQGIVSILLGEQGKQVTGIDIQSESVAFAKELLKNEYAHTAGQVHFECLDFMDYESDLKFDCIIITEVLEHLKEPDRFLDKASKLLEKNGKMIISVPFGVMNHPDHISTFYLTNFYFLLSRYLHLYSFDFMERWMGVTAGRNDCGVDIVKLDIDMLEMEEKNFELIDKKMNQRIAVLYSELQTVNAKYKKITEDHLQLKNEMALQREKLFESEEKYKENLEEQYKDLTSTIICIEDLQRKVQRLTGQNKTIAASNEEYRLKLEKIENNSVWKLEIKIYRLLKTIKFRLIKRVKKWE